MASLLSTALAQVNHLADLDRVFSWLRASWQKQWCTLPEVLDACQQVLVVPGVTLNLDTEMMLQAAHRVCASIEEVSSNSFEPAYHNRLHFADAMVSLTTLMRLQAKTHPDPSLSWMACLLLTVSAHDFKHPGGANAHPHQIEEQSWACLQTLLQGQLNQPWLSIIQDLIMRTDPADVPSNHQLVAGLDFQWNPNWACVLLNEADILASASALHGPGLSTALADEWKHAQHPLHAVVGTPSGRLHFLNAIQFSSPASRSLGIESVVQAQKQSLA